MSQIEAQDEEMKIRLGEAVKAVNAELARKPRMSISMAIKRARLAMTLITPASWIFHQLGCFLVATPSELKQADHFWWDNEDRPHPTKKEYSDPRVPIAQVASDHFRRQLRKGLAWYSFYLSSALVAAIYVAGLVVGLAVDKTENNALVVPVFNGGAGAAGAMADVLASAVGDKPVAKMSRKEKQQALQQSLESRGLNPRTASIDQLNARELELLNSLEATP